MPVIQNGRDQVHLPPLGEVPKRSEGEGGYISRPPQFVNHPWQTANVPISEKQVQNPSCEGHKYPIKHIDVILLHLGED